MLKVCGTSVFPINLTLKSTTSVDACGSQKALEKPRRCGVLLLASKLSQSSLIHRAMILAGYEQRLAVRMVRIS